MGTVPLINGYADVHRSLIVGRTCERQRRQGRVGGARLHIVSQGTKLALPDGVIVIWCKFESDPVALRSVRSDFSERLMPATERSWSPRGRKHEKPVTLYPIIPTFNYQRFVLINAGIVRLVFEIETLAALAEDQGGDPPRLCRQHTLHSPDSRSRYIAPGPQGRWRQQSD